MKKKTTAKIEQLVKLQGKPLQQILIESYTETGSLAGLAEKFSVSQSTISNWILLCGLHIESRLVVSELSESGKQLLKGGGK